MATGKLFVNSMGMSTLEANHSHSIQKLYQVFSAYRARLDQASTLTPIPLLTKQSLLQKPLHQLSPDDLAAYQFKAISTWGDEVDFRYFLPRLMELGSQSIEVVASRLQEAQWKTWPEKEQQALLDFFKTYWLCEMTASGASNDLAADTALCCLGQMKNDLSEELLLWQRYGDLPGERLEPALRQLKNFIFFNQDSLVKKRRLKNAYWKETPTHQQVVLWILAASTLQSLMSRWQDRQYSPYVGSDSGWLEETMAALENLQNSVATR